MDKVTNFKKAISKITDGSTVMIGGFLNCGTPETLVKGIVDKGIKDLTIIANDTAYPDVGIGKLIVNELAKKVIVSHIGTNRETGNQMNSGELDVELVPQGTLAERIRAAGFGLGGFLTPTGVGTMVEKDKKVMEVNGEEYLLELPLGAELGLIKAEKADKKGNLIYDKSARNFNPVIAQAADFVIAEADEIVEVGELDPNNIMTPEIFVDMVIEGRDN